MAERISVNCQSKLTEAVTLLTQLFREKKFVVVTMRPGKDRTLDQNALWFALYERIAKSTGGGRRRGCAPLLQAPPRRADYALR